MLKKIFFSVFLVFSLSFFFGVHISQTLASETEGSVDGAHKYAWGENTGWINFGCDNCGVLITDAGITGYAWSSRFGWINLNPDNSGVANDAEGILSGSAWSSNLGWIDFAGVTINGSGEFLGYATIASNDSQISFNCVNDNSCGDSDFKVKTDWRPASSRTPEIPGGGTGSGGSGYFPQPSIVPPPPTPPIPPFIPLPVVPPAANVVDAEGGLIDSFYNYISNFFTPTRPVVQVPEYAPFSLQSRWNLLPMKAIREFVFAPLPFEIRQLAAKFPELGVTLRDVGIDRFTDADRLSNITFHMPGLLGELEKTIRDVGLENLAEVEELHGITLQIPGVFAEEGKILTGIGAGKIALPKGIPVSAFPLVAKQNLPTEFVFARVTNELLDLNVAVSVGERGQVSQTISTLPGKQLRLVVKPVGPAKSVTGYFVFKSATPKIVQAEIPRSSLSASAIFSMKGVVEQNPEPLFAQAGSSQMENVFVLSSFEYVDDNGDGIYTAEVQTPVVPGEYEIITVIDYIDPVLGVRQMRMITVVDPEGYVFEKRGDKETRIPSAIVSLYVLNTVAKEYELWDAGVYMQENPQITDVRGTYSFLVPEGSYYLHVEAPGYKTYEGKVFTVREGNGVHKNIEMKSGWRSLVSIDLETAILVVAVVLLVYNLYSRRLRNKLYKSLDKNNAK